MAKYKVEHRVVRDVLNGEPREYERYDIFRKSLFGWKKVEYKPSFSLAKKFLRDAFGVKEFQFVDLV